MEKVGFGQLSVPVKIAVCAAWIVGAIYLVIFIVGLVAGAMTI